MLISIISFIICACYLVQSWEAFQSRSEINKLRESLSIKKSEDSTIWTTVGMIFIIPVVISIFISIADRLLFDTSDQIGTSEVPLMLFSSLKLPTNDIADILIFIQSMLLVFISLEMSHVTLRNLDKKWRDLLIIALVLDGSSIGIVYWIKSTKFEKFDLAMLLGLLSIFSSFLIVLYARKVVEIKLQAKLNPKSEPEVEL